MDCKNTAGMLWFQELASKIDKELSKINPDGAGPGRNIRKIAEFLSCFPGMSEYVGSDRMGIEEQLKHRYWVITFLNDRIICEVSNRMGFFEGVLDSTPLKSKEEYVVVSDKDSHIVLVDPDVMGKIGFDNVGSFFKSFSVPEFFVVDFDGLCVMSENTKDGIEKRLVMNIKSQELDRFMETFNKRFNTSVRYSLSVVIAERPAIPPPVSEQKPCKKCGKTRVYRMDGVEVPFLDNGRHTICTKCFVCDRRSVQDENGFHNVRKVCPQVYEHEGCRDGKTVSGKEMNKLRINKFFYAKVDGKKAPVYDTV